MTAFGRDATHGRVQRRDRTHSLDVAPILAGLAAGSGLNDI